jgi:hypothetical protein
MHIQTSTKTMLELTIILDEVQARAAIDDASDLQAQIKQALNGRAVAPRTSRERVMRPKGKRRAPVGNGGELKCPHCDKDFKTQGWLDKHLSAAHAAA